MKPIKYGQIGIGHAHANKISVYAESDDYEVVGIAEPDSVLEARGRKTKPYQDHQWMTVEQLLNTPGLQVVGIETPIRDSVKTATMCLEAGKHIHLDKPGAESFAEFKTLMDLAASKHLVVQMGYMYRYNPAVILLRKCLQRGWLGDPFEVHAVMSKKIGAPERKALAEYPGGTMFELGCHLIDLVVGLLGKPDKVHAFPQHSSKIDDGLQDNMLSVFEQKTSTATIRTSVNEVDGFARRQLTLCSTEGTFHIQPLDNPAARVTFSKPRGKYKAGYQDIKFPKYRRYVGDAADLAKIIRDEKPTDFGYQHDIDVFESIFRASALQLEG